MIERLQKHSFKRVGEGEGRGKTSIQEFSFLWTFSIIVFKRNHNTVCHKVLSFEIKIFLDANILHLKILFDLLKEISPTN